MNFITHILAMEPLSRFICLTFLLIVAVICVRLLFCKYFWVIVCIFPIPTIVILPLAGECNNFNVSVLIYIIGIALLFPWYYWIHKWYGPSEGSSSSSHPMEDKLQIYDADGNVVGYIDKND